MTRRAETDLQMLARHDRMLHQLAARLGRVGGGVWQTPTLVNSWANYGTTFADAQYRLEAGGVVRLRGVIKDGTTTSGTTLFTLPAGFRPGADLIFPAESSGSTHARINVRDTGVVELGAALASSAYLSLSGIAFHADG